MARVQTFLSNEFVKQINQIVAQLRSEGASANEANISSITNMLVGLGLKVYQYRREENEDVFDQVKFNKTLLHICIFTKLYSAKSLAALKLLPDLNNNETFDLAKIKEVAEKEADQVMSLFFPEGDSDPKR